MAPIRHMSDSRSSADRMSWIAVRSDLRSAERSHDALDHSLRNKEDHLGQEQYEEFLHCHPPSVTERLLAATIEPTD
jgi:hypothetical protein